MLTLLYGRPNKPQYGPRSSVRPSVRPSVCPAPAHNSKTRRCEKPKSVFETFTIHDLSNRCPTVSPKCQRLRLGLHSCKGTAAHDVGTDRFQYCCCYCCVTDDCSSVVFLAGQWMSAEAMRETVCGVHPECCPPTYRNRSWCWRLMTSSRYFAA